MRCLLQEGQLKSEPKLAVGSSQLVDASAVHTCMCAPVTAVGSFARGDQWRSLRRVPTSNFVLRHEMGPKGQTGKSSADKIKLTCVSDTNCVHLLRLIDS